MIVRKFDDFLVLFGDESGRKHDQIGTNGIERVGPALGLEAQPFEPVHQIERQKHQLEERHVGGPGIGRDFSKWIIVKHFPVVLFDRGARIVKEVDTPRVEIEVGDKHVIRIFLVFEQRELSGFFRVFWNRTTDHHESMELVPGVVDLVLKLGNFPAVACRLKSTRPSPLLDRGIFLGHDHVAAFCSVEKLDHRATVKCRVHPKANANPGNGGRNFVQACLDEASGARGRSRFSRTKHPVPEFLAMRFEAEDRMVRAPSVLLGVVADLRSLLFAVYRDHDRVDVERQTAGQRRESEQMRAKTVVKPPKLANGLGRQAFQESAQRRLVWETIQAQHFQEGAVVLQDFGFVDASEPHDHGEEQGQNQFAGMIVGGALAKRNVLLQQIPQLQFVAKTLNQPHPTEVGDMGFLEGNADFSSTFWHAAHNTLLGRFVPESFYHGVDHSFSSAFQKTGWAGMAPFAHN